MPSINRRRALQLGAAAAATVALGACSSDTESPAQANIDDPDPNINLEGMPIANDTITLTMMTRRSPNTLEDWNSVASMKRMEELSNIHVDWGLVPWEGGTERRNLALASGDYPGILNRTGMSSLDLTRHGQAGTLLALNQLIDEYMPNLKGVLDANPDIRGGLTLPDGNIYAMPTVFDPEFESLVMARQLWVRQDWLDEFGMEVPTTLDEFEAYLEQAVKDGPTKGGADVIPLIDGASGTSLLEIMGGTFGVVNRGRTVNHIDADESGGVRFYPAADGYREAMSYLHRLYDKGLIPSDIFTLDRSRDTALGKQGVVAATVSMAPSEYYGDAGEDYVALPPLKRDSSSPVPEWTSVSSPLAGMGGFVLTDKVEHPVAAARWMDHFYGDEGARLFFMGVEGESYSRTSDGEYEFLPAITDNEEGLTANEALRPHVNYFGGGYAGIVLEAYFKGTENSAQAREGTTKVADHRLEEVWPAFTYTVEEAGELTGITVDIDKLVGESQSKFINGETPLSDWDAYIGQLGRIGMDRYLEIQQAALDRYAG